MFCQSGHTLFFGSVFAVTKYRQNPYSAEKGAAGKTGVLEGQSLQRLDRYGDEACGFRSVRIPVEVPEEANVGEPGFGQESPELFP